MEQQKAMPVLVLTEDMCDAQTMANTIIMQNPEISKELIKRLVKEKKHLAYLDLITQFAKVVHENGWCKDPNCKD